MASTTQKRQWWSAYRCTAGVRTTFFDRSPVYAANDAVKEAYRALELGHFGVDYVPTPGGYIGSRRSCSQGINKTRPCYSDGTNCSTHNYCISIDIEYQYNRKSGLYPKAHTAEQVFDTYRDLHKYTPMMIARLEGIKTKSGHQLFKWLGWIGDFMHWEIDVPPSDVSVDWNTVPGYGVGSDDMKHWEPGVADPTYEPFKWMLFQLLGNSIHQSGNSGTLLAQEPRLSNVANTPSAEDFNVVADLLGVGRNTITKIWPAGLQVAQIQALWVVSLIPVAVVPPHSHDATLNINGTVVVE